MKLDEIFDPDYYDYLQDEMRIKRGTEDAEKAHNDSASGTSSGDFVVSAFEVGKISAEKAEKELRFQLSHDEVELDFWLQELDMAKWAKEDEATSP